MKRALLILSALVALVAVAAETDIPGTMRIWTETQVLTRGTPVDGGGVSIGMSLRDIDSYRVSLCVSDGGTLAGAGTLKAYAWDIELNDWVPDPTLNLSVTAPNYCQVFPDVEVGVGSGRVIYAASGVTTSTTSLDGGPEHVLVRIKGKVHR